MKRASLLLILGLAGCSSNPAPTTFYLPDADQGSQPFCLSNRSKADVLIPHGATIHPGQMIQVAETRDFEWGFTYPEPATERSDVSCFVVTR